MRKYSKQTVDLYNNPQNMGSLDKNDVNVGTGVVGAPACGDVMKLQIAIDPETKKIVDAKAKTFGCMSAIASSSLATMKIKNLSIEDAKKITNESISEELALPPIKLHCSVLAADAIKAAILDYQSKQHNEYDIVQNDIEADAVSADEEGDV